MKTHTLRLRRVLRRLPRRLNLLQPKSCSLPLLPLQRARSQLPNPNLLLYQLLLEQLHSLLQQCLCPCQAQTVQPSRSLQQGRLNSPHAQSAWSQRSHQQPQHRGLLLLLQETQPLGAPHQLLLLLLLLQDNSPHVQSVLSLHSHQQCLRHGLSLLLRELQPLLVLCQLQLLLQLGHQAQCQVLRHWQQAQPDPSSLRRQRLPVQQSLRRGCTKSH
jgi:hypothetical protein